MDRSEACRNGHVWDSANTYLWRGRKFCRACERERSRLRYVRRQKSYKKDGDFRPHLWMPIPWTGCYIWLGSIGGRDGRARVTFKNRGMNAARAAYWFYFGEPPEHLHVLHACDNPLCVTPAHLFLGTHLDNMADMVRKGRRVGRGTKAQGGCDE